MTSSPPQQQLCPICLDDDVAAVRVAVLPCAHELCGPCALRMIAGNMLPNGRPRVVRPAHVFFTCPLCRGNVTSWALLPHTDVNNDDNDDLAAAIQERRLAYLTDLTALLGTLKTAYAPNLPKPQLPPILSWTKEAIYMCIFLGSVVVILYIGAAAAAAAAAAELL